MGNAASHNMVDMAVQYLLTLLFIGISARFLMGYVWHLRAFCSQAAIVAIKLLNPGWLPRVMIVVPAYFNLTLRGALRLWVRHGFAISFMLLTLVYLSTTMGAATRDDPYTVIGASSSSTTKQIRKLCRLKSLETHPDKHPGREDEIRPLFERISRSCKMLSDPKKKSAYDRFGIVEHDEGSQPNRSMSATSHLGWFGTLLFYSTLCLGLPVCLVYKYGWMLKSQEDTIEAAVTTSKSIHHDLMALYEYSHFGSVTLDCAELYLALGKWELDDQAAILKQMPGSKAAKINSLINAHSERHGLWLDRAKPDDKRVLAASRKLAIDWFESSKAKDN